MRVRSTLVAVLSVTLLATAGRANADITESKRDLLPSALTGFYKWSTEHGVPAGSLGKNDRLVLVEAGAAFADIIVIGPAGADMLSDARALQGVLGVDQEIEYAEEEEGSVVRAKTSNNAFLKRQSVTAVPVAQVASAFQARGGRIISFVRARHYVATTGLRPIDETRRWRYFESSGEPKATLSASLSGSELWGPGIMAFGPLLCLLLGFGAGTVYARRSAVEVERRRAAFKKLVLWPTFGSIAVCLPFAFWLIFGGHLYPIADLWFGSSSVLPFIFIVMATLPILMVALGPINRVETRLFGSEPGQPAEPTVQKSKEVGKGLQLWVGLLPFAMLAIWWIASQYLPREYRWINQIAYTLAFVLIILRSTIVNALLRLNSSSLLAVDPNDPVLQEVAEVSRQVGARVRKLNIAEATSTSEEIVCAFIEGELTVDQHFLQLPEAERRFGLAVTLGHRPGRLLLKMTALMVPLFITVATVGLLGVKLASRLGLVVTLLPAVAFIPMYFWLMRRWVRQEWSLALLQALFVGGDVEAARRFLGRSRQGVVLDKARLSARAQARIGEYEAVVEAAFREYESRASNAT